MCLVHPIRQFDTPPAPAHSQVGDHGIVDLPRTLPQLVTDVVASLASSKSLPVTLAGGVLTDAVGLGLDRLDPGQVDEVLAAHPRGEFKQEFLQAFVDGLGHRPDTAYGTVNADVLERFVPGYRRTSMVDRVQQSPWPS